MPGERAGNGDERRDPWAHLRWNVRPFRMCGSSRAPDRRRQKRNSFEADEMMSTQPCNDLDPTGRIPRAPILHAETKCIRPSLLSRSSVPR